MKASDSTRICPTCGQNDHFIFQQERIKDEMVDQFTYSSRKQPEFMCLKLVRCANCDTIYAPKPPEEKFLSTAYAEASYDSAEEANCAAFSYAQALAAKTVGLPSLGAAIDVGAGNGAMLPYLEQMGFATVVGVEPSKTAIEAAPEQIRKNLREGMFSSALIADVTPSLICAFMTLEHLRFPESFIETAHTALTPGGNIALVVHNWQASLNRLLGRFSPIIDVEHLQLYCPKSLQQLLQSKGFENIRIAPLANSYPLRYWLRLAPVPKAIKKHLLNLVDKCGLGQKMIKVNVGNIMTIAEKPRRL